MKRALVVIDVQKSFQQRALWVASSNPDIVDDVNALVDDARRRGDLVVWVLHTEPGTGGPFDPAEGHVEYLDGLRTPTEDEPQIRKTSINAFTSTNLQQLLVQHGIGRLAVCGIRTEQCCETTTRIASDLAYEVEFVVDATATFPIPHRDSSPDATVEEILADPRTYPTDAILRDLEFTLGGRFAELTTVADVVGVVADVA